MTTTSESNYKARVCRVCHKYIRGGLSVSVCNHCGADQDDQAANPLAQYMPAPCLCCHKYVAGGWTATRCNHCGAMTSSALAERVALLSSRFMVALDYTSTSTRRSVLAELDALLTTLKGYRGRMAAEQAAQTEEAVAALPTWPTRLTQPWRSPPCG
jgi:hypothetical protein